jgi:hypothetical protein
LDGVAPVDLVPVARAWLCQDRERVRVGDGIGHPPCAAGHLSDGARAVGRMDQQLSLWLEHHVPPHDGSRRSRSARVPAESGGVDDARLRGLRPRAPRRRSSVGESCGRCHGDADAAQPDQRAQRAQRLAARGAVPVERVLERSRVAGRGYLGRDARGSVQRDDARRQDFRSRLLCAPDRPLGLARDDGGARARLRSVGVPRGVAAAGPRRAQCRELGRPGRLVVSAKSDPDREPARIL